MTTATEPRAGASGVLEHRTRPLGDTDVQLVRADGEQAMPRFTGHAAVFDSRTAIGNPLTWGWYESVARGAFTKTLAEGDARFLVDHSSTLLVARVSADDLRLAEDASGLAVDADLDTELSYVRDLVRNLDKRRITGMSFGFYVVRDDWATEDITTSDGHTATVDVRTIREVKLVEVSAVTFPAYEDTDAGLRSMLTEVRAARGVHKTPPTDALVGDSAPADATRSPDDPAPAEATQGLSKRQTTSRDLIDRHDLIAARYLLGR
jgi:HK97 family phage prohead protease